MILRDDIHKRDTFWDIVKGIGIICVILGHSCKYINVISFVYLFHIPLFFFVSGYLFNEKKWKGRLNEFIGNRVSFVWIRFIIYGLIFTISHNFLLSYDVIDANYYSFIDMFANWLNYAVFYISDQIAGALWFVLVWLFALLIFATFNEIMKNEFFISFVCIVCSLIGIFLYLYKVEVALHLQTSFVAIGFIDIGHIFRKYISRKNLYSFLNPFVGLFCFVSLILIQGVAKIYIDLNSFDIPGFFIYIISTMGIYLVLCIAKYISMTPISCVFALCGKESLDIMAFHFLIFKCLDIIYALYFDIDRDLLSIFPVSFSDKLWICYFIMGLFLPVICKGLINRVLIFVDRSLKKDIMN